MHRPLLLAWGPATTWASPLPLMPWGRAWVDFLLAEKGLLLMPHPLPPASAPCPPMRYPYSSSASSSAAAALQFFCLCLPVPSFPGTASSPTPFPPRPVSLSPISPPSSMAFSPIPGCVGQSPQPPPYGRLLANSSAHLPPSAGGQSGHHQPQHILPTPATATAAATTTTSWGSGPHPWSISSPPGERWFPPCTPMPCLPPLGSHRTYPQGQQHLPPPHSQVSTS